MPLYVTDNDGRMQNFHSPFEDLFDKFPELAEATKTFHDLNRRTIGPVGLLYVGQREMAVVDPEDENIHFLGSEDATTCHIVIIRHKLFGVVGLTHLDGVHTNDALKDMMKQIKALSKDAVSGYTAYIFGGFNDDRGLSNELSQEIIESLQSSDVEITLHTACMTHKNNHVQNGIAFPIVYGVAIDLKNGDILPATFPDKGPDISLRSARHTSIDNVLSIYNTKERQIEIPPFDYEPLPYAEMWLGTPDDVILRHLSTSPQQEPDDFVTNIKKTIQFTLTTNRNETFKNGRNRVHKLNSQGHWILQ